MQILISIIRWFVGLLFIFSGLIKANDPLGLSYKMQEFFEAWGLHGLHNYTLLAAIAMNVLEVVVGFALIIGWQKKMVSWVLLLLISFFTFLTYYVLYSGKIKACGCFGDCVPLTPQQTFAKDILLLVLAIVILLNQKYIVQTFKTALSAVLVSFSLLSTLLLQFYVLQNLPFADCLPYKKGNNILEQMQVPLGAVPDSIVAISIYNTNGKKVEIVGDNFPENFDSTYVLESRMDKVVRKGNAEPKIKDFTLFSLNGNDTTNAIFNKEKYVLIVVNKVDENLKIQVSDEILTLFTKNNIPVFIVSSSPKISQQINNNDVNYLVCDATVLKTAARVNTTYFLMEKATIKNKLSYKNAKNLLK
ncbi:MAG: BT_3928 family protein [Chitinophagaceae bacterium]